MIFDTIEIFCLIDNLTFQFMTNHLDTLFAFKTVSPFTTASMKISLENCFCKKFLHSDHIAESEKQNNEIFLSNLSLELVLLHYSATQLNDYHPTLNLSFFLSTEWNDGFRSALNNGRFKVKNFWFKIICNFSKILKPDTNASVHHVTMLRSKCSVKLSNALSEIIFPSQVK